MDIKEFAETVSDAELIAIWQNRNDKGTTIKIKGKRKKPKLLGDVDLPDSEVEFMEPVDLEFCSQEYRPLGQVAEYLQGLVSRNTVKAYLANGTLKGRKSGKHSNSPWEADTRSAYEFKQSKLSERSDNTQKKQRKQLE